MFIETISAPREEWESWVERLRLVSEPPDTLVALVAWDQGDGSVTGVHVWETPGAVADFFVERVQPIVEAQGIPAHKPERREPLALYFREDGA